MWLLLVLYNCFLAGWCFKKNILNRIGIIVAWFLGIIIVISSAQAYLLINVFFLLTICTERKIGLRESRRTCKQVMCNSIPALFILFVYVIEGEVYYLFVYACLIASSTSDSIASAVGNRYAQNVYSIISWRKVDRGLSGGVSLQGSLSGIAASFCVSIIYVIISGCYENIDNCIFVITIMGSLGMIIDSLLGAMFQKKYKCSICNRIVEKDMHCGKKAKSIKLPWAILTNNSVNMLSNFILLVICIVCKPFIII